MAKVSMVLASCRPTTASTEQTNSKPTGESPRFFSIQCAAKRNPNMIEDVQIKSHLPCSEVNRFPVMFWIQPSVPSSTAPTRAWVAKSTNNNTDPIENPVSPPTANHKPKPTTKPITMPDSAKPNNGATSFAKNRPSMKQATVAPSNPTSFSISPSRRPFSEASLFGKLCPMNINP